jgi:hypothetical protein
LQLSLPLPFLPQTPPQTNVISTEAARSLIVSRAVERSLYFALALFVIAQGSAAAVG